MALVCFIPCRRAHHRDLRSDNHCWSLKCLNISSTVSIIFSFSIIYVGQFNIIFSLKRVHFRASIVFGLWRINLRKSPHDIVGRRDSLIMFA